MLAMLNGDKFKLHQRRSSAVGTHGTGQGPDQGTGEPMATVLDAEALARLRELDPGGRRGFLPQVLRAYEASLQRHLARLQPAPDGLIDAKTAAEVAHTLKSSSASVGALEFSRRCAQLEKLAKADPNADLMPSLQAVLREGDRAMAAVRAMLRA